tara:strand:+ start:9821 stop:12607 length:2787 start_codon:yes stop_codon:yes gene_type:complete
MTKLIQPSFAGGEISDAVGARVDISKYKTSLSTCTNMFVRTSGGVSNRAGTKFVCEVKNSSLSTRIIPFEFNTDETYCLEIGNQYIRVIVDGGLVVDTSQIKTITAVTKANPGVVTSNGHGLSNGTEVFVSSVGGMEELNGRQLLVANSTTNTFTLQDKAGTDINTTNFTTYTSGGTASVIFEVATPYTTAEVFELDYFQSADVMTLVHPSHEPRELTRTANDAWTLEKIVFQPKQAFPTNVSVSPNTTGSENASYVVTAVNRDNAEESLRGTGSSFSISAITKANPCVVTATGHGVSNGDEIHISDVGGMTELNGDRFKARAITTNTITLTDTAGNDINSTNFTTYTSGGNVLIAYDEISNGNATADNTITWNAASGAESYTIYKEKNGIYGFIGKTEETTFTDDNIDPDLNDTPPKTRNPFKSTNNFPSTGGFFQQRRLFGNTNENRQRLFFSQTANFTNHAVSSPTKDDDAITATIAALQVNEVRHFVPLSDLLVLTSGGEWQVTGVDDRITPSTIQVKPQSYYGSTTLKPIVAGDIAIFMCHGQHVRDLGYKFETDAYAGNDISILARHLFDFNTVVDWDFASAPFSSLWCVRDDGWCVQQTYLREQEIFGWSKHSTKGDFKSVASVREDDDDAVYFIVERKVGGRTVKYVERMAEREFTDVQDWFFVDSGVSLDSPKTITGATAANPVVITSPSHGFSNGDTVDIAGLYEYDATSTRGYKLSDDFNGTGFTVANVTTNTFELQNEGANYNGSSFSAYYSEGTVRKAQTTVPFLWHLEGETVVALANGYVVKDLTVTNGVVTLPTAASRVHVGFPFTAEIETLRLDAGSASAETVQSKAKKVSRLTVRCEQTLGFSVGVSRDRLREAKFGLPAKFGQPPEMLTGDKDVTLPPDWNKDGKYIVRLEDPVPLTVLALIPDVTVGGN